MSWTRLYTFVEGETERRFAAEVLAPHLAQFQVDVRAILLTTNRKLGSRGGVVNYRHVKGDIERHMRQDHHPEARFTTMIDFYALPTDFPGWYESRRAAVAHERVKIIETALQNDIGGYRFIPYIQLHEFEALLYCDLSQLARRISGSAESLDILTQEVRDIPPEEINEGKTTAPSKRIIHHVPAYEKAKVRAGAPAAAAIGLHTLRTRCPHFDAWLRQLEKLPRI